MITETRFTPGPLLVQREHGGDYTVWTRQPHTGTVATVHAEDINGEYPAKENAALFAAAPELYEALIAILGPLNVCSDNRNVSDDVVLPVEMTMGELRAARAALAKAGAPC